MKRKVLLKYLTITILIFVTACDKEDDAAEFQLYEQEISSDKEKELRAKEEFLKLKEEALREKEKQLDTTREVDTTKVADTTTTKPQVTRKQKSLEQKEKELNKRLSNPKTAINDYLEYIKRGVSRDGNFEKNMKNASGLWERRSVDVFKRNYKDTKNFSILSEPSVVSQKGNSATVKVKVKQTERVNNRDKETEMEVVYDLVADKNGNWKIKSNRVVRK